MRTTTGQEIAQTTLTYLGGMGKLKAMIGANHFSHDENGTLTFRFQSFNKANIAQFILASDDTYTVNLLKQNRKSLEVTTYKSVDGLFWDQLKVYFEEETGLYLSL